MSLKIDNTNTEINGNNKNYDSDDENNMENETDDDKSIVNSDVENTDDDNYDDDDDEIDINDNDEIDFENINANPGMPQNKNEMGEMENTGIKDVSMVDSDDDDYDDDSNYLQKFDENIQKNIIAEFHPELKALNYEEIEALTVITRDETGIIIDLLHQTIPFVTRYEKSRVLGERAKQIDAGGEPFVEIEPDVIDGSIIALKEYYSKKIPFIIQRPLPNGGAEYWKLKDLEILE